MTTTADQLDLSPLPPASRREVRDFYQFLMDSQKPEKATGPRHKINELHSNNRCNRGFLSAMLPMIDSDFNNFCLSGKKEKQKQANQRQPNTVSQTLTGGI